MNTFADADGWERVILLQNMRGPFGYAATQGAPYYESAFSLLVWLSEVCMGDLF